MSNCPCCGSKDTNTYINGLTQHQEGDCNRCGGRWNITTGMITYEPPHTREDYDPDDDDISYDLDPDPDDDDEYPDSDRFDCVE